MEAPFGYIFINYNKRSSRPKPGLGVLVLGSHRNACGGVHVPGCFYESVFRYIRTPGLCLKKERKKLTITNRKHFSWKHKVFKNFVFLC